MSGSLLLGAWLQNPLAMLHFLRPGWLWALLGLPLLWVIWRLRRRRANVWRGVVDAHLLPHLLGASAYKRGSGAVWIGMIGYALAILALAGPGWRQVEQPLWQTQSPLVIALDLSSATTATDLLPSRLLQARAKLETLLRMRAGGQVALVVYAGDAFTVAPLTDDAANVALFLDALEPTLMPVDGQEAGRAIEMSASLLQRGGFSRGDILLLTDHADMAARAMAGKAAAEGFRVSAIGLGTPAGAAYRAQKGGFLRARLDAGSLRALASAGNGDYVALTTDEEDLRTLGLLDPQQQAGMQSAQGEKRLAWQDEGYWLLPPLMLLALFAFRRSGAVAVLAVCALLPFSSTVHASDGTLWQRPDQQQHQRLERGAEAYRNGDFAAAEQAFVGIDNADALYNRGNALAKQGRYDEAITAYDDALKRQPGMQDAIANRKAVEAARKRQQQKGGQGKGGSGRQGNSPQDTQQSAGGQEDRQGESSQGNSPQTGKSQQQDAAKPQANPEDRNGRGNEEQQSRPTDPQAQQEADAAQRERMRQAMAQQQAAEQTQNADATGQNAQADTAEQRERRQAVEAWLRRVPDDPGGLLRNKFRLEYERRQRERP